MMYDYRCTACRKLYEELVASRSDETTCPSCGCLNTEPMPVQSFQLTPQVWGDSARAPHWYEGTWYSDSRKYDAALAKDGRVVATKDEAERMLMRSMENANQP